MTPVAPCFEWPIYARSLTREPVKGAMLSSEPPISNEAFVHCLVFYPCLFLWCILKMFYYVSFQKRQYIYIKCINSIVLCNGGLHCHESSQELGKSKENPGPALNRKVSWLRSTFEMRTFHTLVVDSRLCTIGSMYGIFTYIWLIFMVNVVGKYIIHGSYGVD